MKKTYNFFLIKPQQWIPIMLNISIFCKNYWKNYEIILNILINFIKELKEDAKKTDLDIIDIFESMIWAVNYL